MATISRGRRLRPDYTLVILVLLLSIVGIIMVYSASVVSSYKVTGDPNFYFTRQLINIIIGIFCLFFVSRIPYVFWKKVAFFVLLLGLILSTLVFIPGFGMRHGGASRWLELGFIQLQPSEVLKLGVILYLSAFFERVGEGVKTYKAFLPFVIVLGLVGTLIMLQPDMGTFMVIAIFSSIMYFVAGGGLTYIGSLLVAGIAGIWTLIKIEPYRMQRFLVFLNPNADTSGAGYQINQALIAIGTGGLFGLGFNQSRQKYNYLPEAQTDSIIAIIGEELGFVGIAVLIFIFLLLTVRGLRIAKKSPDVFSRMFAIGLISWVAVQSLLNIAAMISLVPLTGVPLPFISFGGTSVVVLLVAFGILINISRFVEGGKSNESHLRRGWNWRSYLTSFSRN
ncbi:MAG: putative lipid II flippase FtsW [Patescibacteria group bacterium]|nr:putative lipid II flippase FtsW [Patescibacteria group bacterium]